MSNVIIFVAKIYIDHEYSYIGKMIRDNIHLLDRTKTNIVFIWSGKVISNEAKPSPNIILPDQINMTLDDVLSNKCFIIPAHVLRTQSIARFID